MIDTDASLRSLLGDREQKLSVLPAKKNKRVLIRYITNIYNMDPSIYLCIFLRKESHSAEFLYDFSNMTVLVLEHIPPCMSTKAASG